MNDLEKRKITVVKRDGSKVYFDMDKIHVAVHKAIKNSNTGPSEDVMQNGADRVCKAVAEMLENDTKVDEFDVEEIQDIVEKAISSVLSFEIAKEYVLYRKKHEEYRRLFDGIQVLENGEPVEFDKKEIIKLIRRSSRDVDGLHAEEAEERIFSKLADTIYDNIEIKDLKEIVEMCARDLVKEHPGYTYVAARIALKAIEEEILSTLDMDSFEDKENYMRKYLGLLSDMEIVDPRLTTDFDLGRLVEVMDFTTGGSSGKLTYLSAITLRDRYLLRTRKKQIVEHPEAMWMRVSMGMSLLDSNPTETAIRFFNILSGFEYMSSTPTLFNSGTTRPQLSSCYLTTVQDDLGSIFDAYKEDALLSKFAGGIANDWTPVRALGSKIKGTNGESEGVIPFIKIVNDTAVAVNQCFSPDTEVLTNRGYVPISEISTGDYVVTADTRFHRVNTILTYPVKGDEGWRYITTQWHSPVKVTGGHPLRTVTNADVIKSVKKGDVELKWTDARDITYGTWTAMPIPIPSRMRASTNTPTMELYAILLSAFSVEETGNTITITFPCTRLNKNMTSIAILDTLKIDHTLKRDKESNTFTLSVPRSHVLGDVPYKLYMRGGYGAVLDVFIRSSANKPEEALSLLLKHHMVDLSDKNNITIICPNNTSKLINGLLLFTGTPSVVMNKVLVAPRSRWLASTLRTRNRRYDDWCADGHYIYQKVTANRVLESHEITWEKMYDLGVEGEPSYTVGSFIAHNGGRRRGAICCYLEPWHADILEFIDLKKNTGDERKRAHDINTALWVPDLLMKRKAADEDWSLFSPDETPDLHDAVGEEFERLYKMYEEKGRRGELTVYRTIPAKTLWRKFLVSLYQTGHPWICWKDPSNVRYPNKHAGVVHSSNLCTEIIELTSKDETAVCNLGSINLPEFIKEEIPVGDNPSLSRKDIVELLDTVRLQKVVSTAVEALDNVIDINYYPTDNAKRSNLRYRPIGLGMMGFQDVLYKLRVPFESETSVLLADVITEVISYYAIEASCELAKTKGAYPRFEGSLWSQGKLPIHTLEDMIKDRGDEWTNVNLDTTLDWDGLAEKVKSSGIRNGNIMAIAPTATISNICGTSQSIEPTYMHLYVKSNLSGEFTHINRYMAKMLQELGLWNRRTAASIEDNDGKTSHIRGIPGDIKKVLRTSFEIDMKWVIKAAARRQKWIDQSASTNLYFMSPTGDQIDEVYTQAWKEGLKTTYYLRALNSTSNREEDTVDDTVGEAAYDAPVADDQKPLVCSILDGDCESCQ